VCNKNILLNYSVCAIPGTFAKLQYVRKIEDFIKNALFRSASPKYISMFMCMNGCKHRCKEQIEGCNENVLLIFRFSFL
jgi:hypothetical protein